MFCVSVCSVSLYDLCLCMFCVSVCSVSLYVLCLCMFCVSVCASVQLEKQTDTDLQIRIKKDGCRSIINTQIEAFNFIF